MYLDPGFGGMLLQIIIALVAAGGIIMFSIRKKISALFSKNKKNAVDVPKNSTVTETDADDTIDMLEDNK